MGAIVNGLTLSGFRAYGAGFLIFCDYMKGAIRLAAIMHIPSTFVFTHDSIGVGEDGPTHQPIEQLVTLRATPNLDLVRPAGFNETALAWRHAARATDRPTVARALAPGPAGVGPGRGARRRDRARRLRAARRRGRARRADPHGHRLRGPHRPRRRTSCSPPTASRYGWSRCPAWTASPSRIRPTATPCCRPTSGRASRSRPRARSAGTAGSATTATSWRWRASAPPRRPSSSTSTSGSRARRWPSGPGRCLRGVQG